MINLKNGGQGAVMAMFQSQAIKFKRYHVVMVHKRDPSVRVEIWAETEADALPHELFYQSRGFVVKK